MAKIKNAKPKQKSGGYERLLGNKEMASIFTKAQSTVISNGTELEKIIIGFSNKIYDLDAFINDCDTGTITDGTYLCSKKVVGCSSYKLNRHEPDFIVFVVGKTGNECFVIELKDGDAFDTKKSFVEKELLKLFVNHFAPKVPFKTKFFICCFNQPDKNKIVAGLKGAFDIDEVMTGEELCDVLNINYNDIVKMRQDDATDNLNYVSENMIFAILGAHMNENELKMFKEFCKTHNINGVDAMVNAIKQQCVRVSSGQPHNFAPQIKNNIAVIDSRPSA